MKQRTSRLRTTKESIGKEVPLPFLLNPDVIDANKDFFDPMMRLPLIVFMTHLKFTLASLCMHAMISERTLPNEKLSKKRPPPLDAPS